MLTKKQHNRQRGQSMVEYAFIIALVALGALASLQLFGTSLVQLYNTFPGAF